MNRVFATQVKTFKFLIASISFLLLMTANFVLAQPVNPGTPGQSQPINPGTPGQSQPVNPGGAGALQNPLNNINGVEDLLVAILEVLIIIAVPIIVIFIILAGFKYVTARGNAQQIQEASRALTYAIIGAVLVVGALAIAEIIKNLVAAF